MTPEILVALLATFALYYGLYLVTRPPLKGDAPVELESPLTTLTPKDLLWRLQHHLSIRAWQHKAIRETRKWLRGMERGTGKRFGR